MKYEMDLEIPEWIPPHLRALIENLEHARAARHAPKRAISYVYAIGREDEGAVKIGYAKDPRKRLSSLQTGSSSKLNLLVAVPCEPEQARKLEADCHEDLAHLRIHGEWFHVCPRIAIHTVDMRGHALLHGRTASRFKAVHYSYKKHKWIASRRAIGCDMRKEFDDEESAARFYDEWALRGLKDLATTNEMLGLLD